MQKGFDPARPPRDCQARAFNKKSRQCVYIQIMITKINQIVWDEENWTYIIPKTTLWSQGRICLLDIDFLICYTTFSVTTSIRVIRLKG